MKSLYTAILASAVALGVAGCTSTTQQRPAPPAMAYAVQRPPHLPLSVPTYNWGHARHQAIDLNTSGELPMGVQVQGGLNATGGAYASVGPRYDFVRDTADVNGDGRVDLIRVTMDTQIVASPIPDLIGRSVEGRAIIADFNFDGRVDALYIDNVLANGEPGYDGRYDQAKRVSNTSIDEALHAWVFM